MDTPTKILYPEYMEKRRIFIVGDTLFAETLVALLAHNPDIEIVGVSADLENIQPALKTGLPDALIYTRGAMDSDSAFTQILTNNPELPLLCADLSSNAIQIIHSRHISIHSSNELLAALAELPKRS
jgi:hypothetical protein